MIGSFSVTAGLLVLVSSCQQISEFMIMKMLIMCRQQFLISLDSVQHLALHAMLNFLTTDHQLQHFVHGMLRVFLQFSS